MLALVDWIIIISFLILSLAIGLYYRKDAGKSLSDFFLGGRNLPWYIAGISMVATTFAADTPLAVSELVSQGGIAKNWLWWSFIFGGALTTFFFAMLWRRANILTELEFIELRYHGNPAKFLRLFKATYLGLFINAVIIAWVNLAMMSLIEVFFDVDKNIAFWITMGLMVLAVVYAALSGLKGVAVTDTVQFILAMTGCIILAILVVNDDKIGGVAGLQERLPQRAFDFVPRIGGDSSNVTDYLQGFGLTLGAFFAFVAIQWWSSWYPGSEPGGGGYVAQRMMSTRSEKDSVWATLLFQIGHYCIRPWPWIVVGLCAIALYTPTDELKTLLTTESMTEEQITVSSAEEFIAHYPQYRDTEAEKQVRYHFEPRLGFVFAMKDFLPKGLVGLLLVAFIAAYLSTISTQVNWGASYVVNDLIMPLSKVNSQKNLVLISRLASVGIMILGGMVTPLVTSISGVWAFVMQCGAGLGLVLILRWYWWRINAWSEITATIAPLIAYSLCYFYLNDTLGPHFVDNYGSFYVTVGFTTICWILVTYITSPTDEEKLRLFEERVQPMGVWPSHFTQVKERNKQLKWLAFNWLSMVVFIISFLFLIGSLILAKYEDALVYFVLSILSTFGLRFFLKKTNIFEGNSESA